MYEINPKKNKERNQQVAGAWVQGSGMLLG